MSLHHERQRAQHGHPLHRDHAEDLETGIATAVREIDQLRAERDQLRDTVTGYEGAIEGLSNTIGEQRAQLESVREYVQSLRDLATVTRDAGGDYLARVYDDIATILERKIGDRT